MKSQFYRCCMWSTLAIVGAVATAGCAAPSNIEGNEDLNELIELVKSGDPDKITHAIEVGETFDQETSERFIALARESLGLDNVSMEPMAVWSGVKLPVNWAWWPTGTYPYQATSAYGHCGNDTDLIARYAGIYFNSVSQLYLTTNNAVTWAVASFHGFRLTEWEADTVTHRVSICAGLSVLAGLPIVQNQLASMTLNVRPSAW